MGLATRKVEPEGEEEWLSYDKNNLLTREERLISANPLKSIATSYYYDGAYRLLSTVAENKDSNVNSLSVVGSVKSLSHFQILGLALGLVLRALGRSPSELRAKSARLHPTATITSFSSSLRRSMLRYLRVPQRVLAT